MALAAAAENVSDRLEKTSEVWGASCACCHRVPGPLISVLAGFTVVLFAAVAGTSPAWHLEEA